MQTQLQDPESAVGSRFIGNRTSGRYKNPARVRALGLRMDKGRYLGKERKN